MEDKITKVNEKTEEQKAVEESRAADKKVRRQDYTVIILGCALVLLAKIIS